MAKYTITQIKGGNDTVIEADSMSLDINKLVFYDKNTFIVAVFPISAFYCVKQIKK